MILKQPRLVKRPRLVWIGLGWRLWVPPEVALVIEYVEAAEYPLFGALYRD